MKYCPNCKTMNEDDAVTCTLCGASLDENDMVSDEPKAIYPLFFLLIPTLLVGVYGFLAGMNVLPEYIRIFNITINLVPLFWNVFTSMIGVVALFIIPLIFLFLLVGRIDERNAAKDAEEAEAVHANRFLGANNAYEEWHERKHETQAAEEGLSYEFKYRRLKDLDAIGENNTKTTDVKSLESLSQELVSFAASKGLAFPNECARALLSAMAASRVLYVIGKNPEITENAITTVAKFFGESLTIDTIAEKAEIPEDLAVIRSEVGLQKESEFIVDVYSALYNSSTVRFAALGNVDPQKLGSYFQEYMKSAMSGECEVFATVPAVSNANSPKFAHDGKMLLPHNLWYVLMPINGANAFARPVDAIPVDISTVTLTTPASEGEIAFRALPALSGFNRVVRKAKEVNYIPEEYWKKIDMLEAYIAKRVAGYTLDNISIRKIEAFVGVYMELGGKLYEAIDYFVSAKMLPTLYGCETEKISGADDGLASTLDRIFGLDNMPHSLECARKLGAV